MLDINVDYHWFSFVMPGHAPASQKFSFSLSPSEWKTLRLMRDNSSACELVYGEEGAMPGLHTLYGIAPRCTP